MRVVLTLLIPAVVAKYTAGLYGEREPKRPAKFFVQLLLSWHGGNHGF